MADRYSQAARIMAVNSLSPKFSNEYDRKKYYDYTSELGRLNSLRSDLSAMLLSKADPLSPAVSALKKKISSKRRI
ncbi:MAG: hypothetical protein M0C28_20555 [Candidatus Moduliflexus flocculans]|nr:hypothetical protein [Candidatus Moduliflexus flocculans]